MNSRPEHARNAHGIQGTDADSDTHRTALAAVVLRSVATSPPNRMKYGGPCRIRTYDQRIKSPTCHPDRVDASRCHR